MIADLKPYPAMKDSGVPWLGQVPAHWDVVAARAAYRPKLVRNIGMVEKTVLSLSYGRIIMKPPEKLRGLVPESFETYQIISPGDIIVRTTDLQNDQNSLRIGYSKNRGIITAAYMCLTTSERMEPEFGYQFLNAYDLLKIIYGYGSGLRQNLDFTHIKRMPVLIPHLSEQAAIVRFLDHADRLIRGYIRAKQKLIKLLEEQKQVIVNHAVTRGLDPNVRLKPSGVEWLGDVPEHWDIKRTKYFYREVDERSKTGDEELLSVSHITGVTPRSQKNITMFMAQSYVGHKICRADDLVINTMWAWMGALGVSRQVGIVSPSYGVYRPVSGTHLLGEFANLLLHTRPYVSEYICRSTGIRSSRLRLYPEQFLRIKIACPPQDEQEKILSYIEQETKSTDRAISSARDEIELLREYRTRLIADVVTGKLDVRDTAAKLPDVEMGEDSFVPDTLEDENASVEEFSDLLEETDED
jgi:type I restriction enzyme S subunit